MISNWLSFLLFCNYNCPVYTIRPPNREDNSTEKTLLNETEVCGLFMQRNVKRQMVQETLMYKTNGPRVALCIILG